MTKEERAKVLQALEHSKYTTTEIDCLNDVEEAIIIMRKEPEPQKLWLWKNFVDGKQEYWAFDNLYPVHMDGGDPQTLGEPCGYALFKPSRNGRPGEKAR